MLQDGARSSRHPICAPGEAGGPRHSVLRAPRDQGLRAICAAKHVAGAVQRENLLVGKNPSSIAGACIYLVGQLSDPASQRSFEQIAHVTSITADTRQKAYIEIHLRRLTLVPIDVEDVKWVTTTDLVHAMPPS